MKNSFIDVIAVIFLVYQNACVGMEFEWIIMENQADTRCVNLPGIFIDKTAHLNNNYDISANLGKSRAKVICTNGTHFERQRSSAPLALQNAESKFTLAQREALLNLHNKYRAMVQPPAADINFMAWHDEAAMLAQMWAENCDFSHGFPPDHALSNQLGQNLYMGPDKGGLRATRLWFEEKSDYDINRLYCKPDKMCGHYTQVVWADSNFVGCGIKQCQKNQNLIVCHYFPAGNIVGMAPYKIGNPCSMCANIRNGGLCFNNSCVSKERCNALGVSCSCGLYCHNCGRLDAAKCACDCVTGWDRLDCSVPCKDNNEKCGKNPGFPKQSCHMQETIKTTHCRKLCRQCSPVSHDDDPSKLCCSGAICEEGLVLDQGCRCVPKCKGSNCIGGKSNNGKSFSSTEFPARWHHGVLLMTVLLMLYLN